MDIEASGAIKHFYPNPSLMLVYFEALANALDANATAISIDIEIDSFDKPETLKVTILTMAMDLPMRILRASGSC